MQAIILAAGIGNRLKSITKGLPKCYLKINGEKLLERQIRLLEKHDINDITIVTGYQSDRIEKDFKKDTIKFIFNPFYETTNVLTSFWLGLPTLNDNFIFLHADTIFHEKILSNLIEKKGDIILPIDFKKCGEEEMKVQLEGNFINKINKTMDPKTAEGEFIGIAKLSKKTLPILSKICKQILKEKDFNNFFESTLQKIIDQNAFPVHSLSIKDLPWNEIDFPEDYLLVKKIFGQDKIHPG